MRSSAIRVSKAGLETRRARESLNTHRDKYDTQKGPPRVTPTRLRQIAQQLVNNCSAYQEKVTRIGAYRPCHTCNNMAEELRELAKNGNFEHDANVRPMVTK